MTATSAQTSQRTPVEDSHSGRRSVLDQLLHALNQPLTGLQCSIEVALAAPREPEQYARTLRDGLELTGRMRALVGAIREVLDGQSAASVAETFELMALLRERVAELAPVAEAKGITVAVEGGEEGCEARTKREEIRAAMFRLLESAISLADHGTPLRIHANRSGAAVKIEIEWSAAQPTDEMSLSELGLLLAQAGCERIGGARWERTYNGKFHQVVICLHDAAALAGGKS
jgi:signal transduction histidine kinase